MTLGSRIKQRRFQFGVAAGIEGGFTQEYLASILDISQGYFSQAENDQVRLPLLTMQRFAAMGGMTVAGAFPEWTLTRKERKQLEAARGLLHGTSHTLTNEVDE